MRRDLEVLGTRIAVETDSAALVGRLDGALGRFRSAERAETVVHVSIRELVATVADRRVALTGERPIDHAFGLVYRFLLDRIGDFLVLHAAALERHGRALLLAAPSGAGKTTLALALLERGFRLLSDDFSPIDRATGLVHPFPKAPRVRPGPGRRLGPRIPPLAERPARPAVILMFDGRARPPAPTDEVELTMSVAGPSDPLLVELAGIAGVRRVARRGHDVVVHFTPRPGAAARLDEALSEAPGVLEYGVTGRPPGYRSRAQVLDLPAGAALLPLLRDMQNRRAGGALWRSVGADPLRLAAELGALLADVRVAWLVPGRPRATAALVSRLLD